MLTINSLVPSSWAFKPYKNLKCMNAPSMQLQVNLPKDSEFYRKIFINFTVSLMYIAIPLPLFENILLDIFFL
jgi:hypothetical protein